MRRFAVFEIGRRSRTLLLSHHACRLAHREACPSMPEPEAGDDACAAWLSCWSYAARSLDAFATKVGSDVLEPVFLRVERVEVAMFWSPCP